MNTTQSFLIGATRSGSGKTLLTLGLLAAINKRGFEVQPFKCGPDFIDPTLHQVIVNRPSFNLDIFMMGEKGSVSSFDNYSAQSEISVVEGVMGLFDGGQASSASLAKLLKIPVLLIVDASSAAESVAAVIHGFENFDPELELCGVICNRVGSTRHRELIEEAVKKHCNTEILGFFPRETDFVIESRHLGLHMGHEAGYDRHRIEKLTAAVEQHIDIDRLLEKSGSNRTRKRVADIQSAAPVTATRRLAVARDEAFCFYYQENFDLLKANGFELVNFSPMVDSVLPSDINGVYLGGGYPELFADQLSTNQSMKQSLREWADKGGFIYGECGGFMYMTEKLVDTDGKEHPMTGIFPVTVKMKSRLSRLGYREVRCIEDTPFGKNQEPLFGHEFHYSDIVERSEALEYLYSLGDGKKEGCRVDNCFGSYVHLHFSRSQRNIQRLLEMLS